MSVGCSKRTPIYTDIKLNITSTNRQLFIIILNYNYSIRGKLLLRAQREVSLMLRARCSTWRKATLAPWTRRPLNTPCRFTRIEQWSCPAKASLNAQYACSLSARLAVPMPFICFRIASIGQALKEALMAQYLRCQHHPLPLNIIWCTGQHVKTNGLSLSFMRLSGTLF